VFDTYFDKILYQQLGRAIRKTRERDVIKLVGMDIDFYNILGAIRGKFWGLEEQQIQDLIVTSTPTAPRELLNRMIATNSVKDAFNELVNTRYKSLEAIALFERAFEMGIYTAARRSFTKMFSFATIIGITKLTTFEVRNLAAIAFAVEQNIPSETTMSKIIIENE